VTSPVASQRIVRIEWARLEGQRPRPAGGNARLGAHGQVVRPPIARLTLDDGTTGFGFSRATRERAQALAGRRFDEVFSYQRGPGEAWLAFEYPLWDLAGRLAGVPVYALAATINGRPVPASLRVPCYDTSLYFDDLHLADDVAAAARIAAEAMEGYARGHRAFKLKVGRGARHLPLEEGTRRDIAVVRAVRESVGPDARLMLDANNGYNLNLAKRVLAETAGCRVFWLEEAFHEDAELYRDLRAWLDRERLGVLIADGEGQASPSLMAWASEHVIDVVQYDIFSPGFTRWLEIGRQLDAWGVRAAPHHYGGLYGNYVSPHLAGAIERYTFAEWDEASTPALDTSAYRIEEGKVAVPNLPGFGLALDDTLFRRAVADGGYEVSAP
jgi:L-rhamnonate dehydratase